MNGRTFRGSLPLAHLLLLTTLTVSGQSRTASGASGDTEAAATGTDSAAAVAETLRVTGAPVVEEEWVLGDSLHIPSTWRGKRLRAHLDSTLNINLDAGFTLHAEPHGKLTSFAEIARRVSDCDSVRTAVSPGDWDVYVIATDFEQVAAVEFSFDYPDDWIVHGFRLNPELRSPFMVGGLDAGGERPTMVAFTCVCDPGHTDLLLPRTPHSEGSAVVIGVVTLTATSAGSIGIADHRAAEYAAPEIADCYSNSEEIPASRRGRIDVGRGPGAAPCRTAPATGAAVTGGEAGGASGSAPGGGGGTELAAGGTLLAAGATELAAGATEPADDPVVVRVGDIEVTRSQFEAGFAHSEIDTTLSESENRSVYLGSMIDRYLLVAEAESRGALEKSPQVQAMMEEFKAYTLMEKIRDAEIRSKVHITDEDVRRFYARHAVLYDVSQIIVATEEEARAAIARIEGGESFEDVARDVSVDAKSRREGGHLKPFVWGATSTEFMNVISNLKPGEISEPYRSDYGWHVFLLNAVTPRDQEPFEERREFLAHQLNLRRQGDIQLEFYRMLRDRYDCETELDTARELASIYASALDWAEETAPEGDADQWGAIAMGRVTLSDSLLAQPILRWDMNGKPGQYTVNDHWTYMRQLPAAILVDRRNPLQIVNDGYSEFHRRAMVEMAYERGLDQLPEVEEAIDLKREEMILTIFYQQEVLEKSSFTEEDERQYYEEHLGAFTVPRALRIARIRYRDREAAEEAERLLATGGADLESMIARHRAADLIVTDEPDAGWLTEAQDPLLLEQFDDLEKGSVGRYIDPDQGYHTVFLVLDKQEEHVQPFEEARPTIQNALRVLRSEQVLNAFLDELRDKYTVWYDDAVLEPAAH